MNIPYTEVTPRQKEFLFHFVRYIARLLSFEHKGKRITYWACRSYSLGKMDLKKRNSYGFKHDLEEHRHLPEHSVFMKHTVFRDDPDFEFFYCTNDTFKQAMLECDVRFRHDDARGINWQFLGGFKNEA